MANCIAFSLYLSGVTEASRGIHYQTGAIRNAERIAEFYPGWKMVVYCDSAIPLSVVDELCNRKVDVRTVDNCSMFHRFLINDDPTVERYLVRDADSRLNKREAGAVKEWIESGKSFHVIRDHPHHPQPMLGGLWGGTTGKFNMASLMHGVNIKDRSYGADMRFLAQRVWLAIKNDCFQHDLCTWREYVGAKRFTASFEDMRFAGEVYDAEDRPRKYDAA